MESPTKQLSEVSDTSTICWTDYPDDPSGAVALFPAATLKEIVRRHEELLRVAKSCVKYIESNFDVNVAVDLMMLNELRDLLRTPRRPNKPLQMAQLLGGEYYLRPRVDGVQRSGETFHPGDDVGITRRPPADAAV